MQILPKLAQQKLKFKIELTKNSSNPRLLLAEVELFEKGFLCPAVSLESFNAFLETRDIKITQASIYSESEDMGITYFLDIRNHPLHMESSQLVQIFNSSLR